MEKCAYMYSKEAIGPMSHKTHTIIHSLLRYRPPSTHAHPPEQSLLRKRDQALVVKSEKDGRWMGEDCWEELNGQGSGDPWRFWLDESR